MALGVLFQYLRSRKSTPDWLVAVLMLVACVGAQWLAGVDLSLRPSWGMDGTLGLFLMTLGVSQGTSMVANIGVKMGLNPTHAAVPVTNSK
jgi:hypothetical protein